MTAYGRPPTHAPRDLSPLSVLTLRLRLGVENEEPAAQTQAALWRLADGLQGTLSAEQWAGVVRFLAVVEAQAWP